MLDQLAIWPYVLDVTGPRVLVCDVNRSDTSYRYYYYYYYSYYYYSYYYYYYYY